MRFEQQRGGRVILACVFLLPLVGLVACGGGDMPAEPGMEEPMSEPAADAAPATGGAARVFFVAPDDGATARNKTEDKIRKLQRDDVCCSPKG